MDGFTSRNTARLTLRTALLGAALAAAAGLATTTAAAAGPGSLLLGSGITLPGGAVGGSPSGSDGSSISQSSVSGDGRYVAFVSSSDAFSDAVDRSVINVFRKDRTTGAVELVSRADGAGGAGAARNASSPVISSDGARVGFITDAALVPGDVDATADVYVRDLGAGTTLLASPGGTGAAFQFDLSGNGRYVAFATTAALVGGDVNGQPDVYRRDLLTDTTVLASRIVGVEAPVNASSAWPSISDNGRWVAYATNATNVIAGFVDGGASLDVYARDLNTNQNYLVSARSDSAVTGGNGESSRPHIAGAPTDQTTVRIAYASDATNLALGGVDASSSDSAYVRGNLNFAWSTLASRAPGVGGASADSRAHVGGISDDGLQVVFASDAGNLGAGADYYGAYLRHLGTGTTTLISAANDYAVQPAIAANGLAAVWYEHDAVGDLPAIFGRALPGGPIELVSRPPGSAPYLASAASVEGSGRGQRAVSADGRYLVFAAGSRHLPSGETRQVYRRDQLTGALTLVSRATGAGGAPLSGNYGLDHVSIDASGNRVLFTTTFALDPADGNGMTDAYVRDLTTDTTTLVSRATGPAGAPTDAPVERPVLSADGGTVLFLTQSTNLGVPGGDRHVYVRDLQAATTTVVDRAAGEAGVVGNDDAGSGSLSADGRLVAFSSRATNLHADDPTNAVDVYVRDRVTHAVMLVSRRAGLDGVKATGWTTDPVISGDGRVVAFTAEDQQLAPEAGPWGGNDQVVARTLATGVNTLMSRAGGGAVANQPAYAPSISGNGSVVAFETNATNLLPGVGGVVRRGVFARDLTTGTLDGPPAFGLDDSEPQHSATDPSLSEDGRCLSFVATGANALTGAGGDFRSAYVYVRSGGCPTPSADPEPGSPQPTPSVPGLVPPVATPAAVRPVLSAVSLRATRFTLGRATTPVRLSLLATRAPTKAKKKTAVGTTFRFTLNTASTVTIVIERRLPGRRVGKRCRPATKALRARKACTRSVKAVTLTRTAQAAGKRAVAFSGRYGKKRLAAGSYRATLRATNAAGSSKIVRRTFRVVPR